MAFSVNTNAGALVALQNLSGIDTRLQTTQNRISTGYDVASAKDDGGIFAIAEGLRADVMGYGAVQNSLSRGISTVDTGLAAAESIMDLLKEMKAKALAASDTSLDTASREALNEDFTALRDQITTIKDNASFNGVNLVNASAGISSLANLDGTDIDITGQNLSLGGSSGSGTGAVITVLSTNDISAQSKAETLVSTIEASINNLGTALAKLGTAGKKLQIQSDFVQILSDEAEKGIGALVDADLARESAELQALQVQQQLASQALSIANQAPQTVLSLFQ